MDEAILDALRAIDLRGAIWLSARLSQYGVFDATAAEMAVDADIPADAAQALLDCLARASVVTTAVRYLCPDCGTTVSPTDTECNGCQSDLGTEAPTEVVAYRRLAAPGRDVPWMLLIHGMNTRGAWQEQFAWRAAVMHGRSIPVFSYKYGVLRPGVLLPFRRRQLIRRTVNVIAELAGDANELHLGTRPDVIAHSFGTWLIVHALLAEPTLRIGRLILTGSIIRTDFDWSRVATQHDGILNHRAGKDRVVTAARCFIPDSGPSGVKPFAKSDIGDVIAPTWGHNDYFTPTENLRHAFDAIWAPFLREPASG